MKHTPAKLMLFLMLLCTTGFVCSKNKCHSGTLIFNNDTDDTITVLVYTKGEKDIAPGASDSFRLRPDTYQYDVSKYMEEPFIEREITVTFCMSKEINIKE